MANLEKISGKEKLLLFRQLIEDRSLVQFHIPDCSLDGLTVLRDMRKNWGTWYFLVDMPPNLWRNIANPKTVSVDFECTGRDRLKYRFRAEGGKSRRGGCWLKLPDVVEKRQQREHFRVDAAMKARIICSAKGFHRKMTVVNVSEGGALIQFKAFGTPPEADDMAREGTVIEDAELVISLQGVEQRINIDRLEVGRVTVNTATGQRTSALRFAGMDVGQKNRLTRLIYDLQREFLKKRLPVGR